MGKPVIPPNMMRDLHETAHKLWRQEEEARRMEAKGWIRKGLDKLTGARSSEPEEYTHIDELEKASMVPGPDDARTIADMYYSAGPALTEDKMIEAAREMGKRSVIRPGKPTGWMSEYMSMPPRPDLQFYDALVRHVEHFGVQFWLDGGLLRYSAPYCQDVEANWVACSDPDEFVDMMASPGRPRLLLTSHTSLYLLHFQPADDFSPFDLSLERLS
jgi:hypothetical protein